MNDDVETVTKAAFKARALEICRRIEATGAPVIITDRGRPVLRLAPFFGGEDTALETLRGSVVEFRDPTEPVDAEAWEADA